MIRWLRMLAGLLIGVVIGAVSVLTVQDAVTSSSPTSTPGATLGSSGRSEANGSTGSNTPDDPGRGSAGTSVEVLPSKIPQPATETLLLAWMPDRLPDGAAAKVRTSAVMSHVTAVRRNELDLTQVSDRAGRHLDLRDGYVIPLDTMAFDPATYLDFVPPAWASLLGSMRTDQIVLGSTGARLRGVGTGASLVIAGRVFQVVGVVDDDVLGGAEVGVTHQAGLTVGLQYDRYLLAMYTSDRPAAEAVITSVLGPDPIRFRGPVETPFLRNADAVLPTATIKETFGEFAIRRDPALVQDETWRQENVVEASVPLLGAVRCHRAVLPALRGALAQIEREQLAYLVDPAMSTACWRLGTIRSDRRLSRQAWGIGFELNSVKNRTGQGSVQDDRMIKILQDWGFTWGGSWLVPEPSYFEYLGPPHA